MKSPSLTNRRILLGVTGGIAAYKSAELIRRLKDAGADVRVVMTAAAREFITPLTLQALSGNPVHLDMLDPKAEAAMGHIELARWGDAVIIAPASADFMSKLANGEGSDLLATLCLASKAPLLLAPAMNQAMWANAATQSNVAVLESRGIVLLGPDAGSQACGDIGPGRMMEPGAIADAVAAQFQSRQLEGKTVVITAGPTREAIDPVRYISNHSSGKMGYALAQAAVDAGAVTHLVSGPVHLSPPERVTLHSVQSAQQMFDCVITLIGTTDIFIGAAAVSDYRVREPASQKLKKQTHRDTLTLELIKNPDIIAAVAQRQPAPFTVGFAAETQQVESYAREKLARKKLHAVIANDVSDASIGFNSDDNRVLLIDNRSATPFDTMSKTQLARELIAAIAVRFAVYPATTESE